MADSGPREPRRSNWSRRFNPPRPANLPAGTPPSPRIQLPANSWPAEAGPGKLIGWVLVVLLALLGVVFVWRFSAADGALRGLWLGLLLLAVLGVGFVAYQLWRLAQLRYTLTDDALVIERGRETTIVPYERMLRVVRRPRDQINTGGYERLWPGLYISRFTTEEGVWESFATVPPNRRVRIVLEDRTIAISPMRPILFLEALEERRGAEPAPVPEPAPIEDAEPQLATDALPTDFEGPPLPTAPPPSAQRPRDAVWPRKSGWKPAAYQLFREELLADRVASEALAVSVIILAGMSIYAGYSVDGMFQDVVVRWNANGDPIETVAPRGIWLYPLMGLGLLVLNTALATIALLEDRFITRLIMVATPVLQVLIALALWWAIG